MSTIVAYSTGKGSVRLPSALDPKVGWFVTATALGLGQSRVCWSEESPVVWIIEDLCPTDRETLGLSMRAYKAQS